MAGTPTFRAASASDGVSHRRLDPQPPQDKLQEVGMRLTVTSVVATGSAIDELGQLGAVQIIAKLAAATVRRDSNLPAGIPDLTQKGFRAPKRVYTFQIVALEVVT
jgi:hypothetical protein